MAARFLTRCFAVVAFLNLGLIQCHPCSAQSSVESSELKSFSLGSDSVLLPGFGTGEHRFPTTQDDLEDARRLVGQYDRDGNQMLDAKEVQESRLARVNAFSFDWNKDGRLSVSELTQREASERYGASRRTTTYNWLEARLKPPPSEERSTQEDSYDWRRNSNRESRTMVGSLLDTYDRNRSRTLNRWELTDVGIPLDEADRDGNGELDFRELDRWLAAQIEDRVNDLSDILPDWFFEKDKNDDDQIEMSEFSEEWTQEKLQEFASLDSNADGLITTAEILNAKSAVGGRFDSERAVVIAPRAKLLSEIVVNEDFEIDAIEVELSLTHSYLEHLDVYVLGPGGERVELFTAVGGSDDNFESARFADDAGEDIRRARAPFRDRYRPEAIENGQPGLNRFREKSVRGVWQLLIEADRSERFGLLNRWAIIVQPKKKSVAEPPPAVQE